MLQEYSLILGVSALWIATFVFIKVYYSRLKRVSKEYCDAKDIVERIVVTFRHRYDDLSSGLRRLEEKIPKTTPEMSEITEKITSINEGIQMRIHNLEITKEVQDKLVRDVQSLQTDVHGLKEAQAKFAVNTSGIRRLQPVSVAEIAQRPVHTHRVSGAPYVTATEKTVLDYLLLDGPRTAKEIEAKINKTREHTARLMKKLWQEGYVERETHRIPYIYRASDALHNLENTST